MPGELVHGVIYEVLVKELLELDILESVPQGFYKRKPSSSLGGMGNGSKQTSTGWQIPRGRSPLQKVTWIRCSLEQSSMG